MKLIGVSESTAVSEIDKYEWLKLRQVKRKTEIFGSILYSSLLHTCLIINAAMHCDVTHKLLRS